MNPLKSNYLKDKLTRLIQKSLETIYDCFCQKPKKNVVRVTSYDAILYDNIDLSNLIECNI